MKRCSTCKQEKQLTEFHNSAKTKDKKYPRCKPCDNEARKLWIERNPERSQRSRRGRWLKFCYGITLEEYEKLLTKQNNCCALCETKENTIKEIKPSQNKQLCFAVDHDHITGRVRGLLCNQCNRALGMFKDDPNLLRSAIQYLESN